MSLNSVIDSGLGEMDATRSVGERKEQGRRERTDLDPVRQSLQTSSVSEDGESVGVRVDDVIQQVDRLDDDLRKPKA